MAGRLALPIAAALLAATVSACSGSSTTANAGANSSCAKTTTLTLGTTGTVADAGLVLAQDLGYFQRYCVSVKFMQFAGSPDEVTALASNKIQIAGLSAAPGLFTAQHQNLAMKAVGDKGSMNSKFTPYGIVVATKDMKATTSETLHGLVGKNIILQTLGNTEAIELNRYFSNYGLSLKDFNVVILPFNAVEAAIGNGRADFGFSSEPYTTQMVQRGVAKVLDDPPLGSIFGDKEPPILATVSFGPFLLDPANRAIALGFMKGYILGVRYYNDVYQKHMHVDEAEKIIANSPLTKVPVDLLRAESKPYLDPNMLTQGDAYARTLTFWQQTEDYFVTQNLIKPELTTPAENVWDLSFARDAVKELGVYS